MLDAADVAVLDGVAARMDDAAEARFAAFAGRPQPGAAAAPRPPLSANPLLHDVASGVARLAAARSARAPLATDGIVGRGTLAALDEALAGAPLQAAKLGGKVDQADVVVDLTSQVAYVNAALVDPAKLDGLLARLNGEPTAAARTR